MLYVMLYVMLSYVRLPYMLGCYVTLDVMLQQVSFYVGCMCYIGLVYVRLSYMLHADYVSKLC